MTDTGGPAPGTGTAAAPGAVPEVRTSRLVATLGGAGALAGLLLVFVFGLTLPTIEANKARALRAAIEEVLKAPDRYETLYVVNGRLSARAPEGVDARKLERVYLGRGPDNRRVGFAIVAGQPGFQDVVQLIFGYDPPNGRVLGMKVLESKETPGLGDKIEKDLDFVSQFEGAEPPLVGVKSRRGAPRTDPHEVHVITGATISSRTVIRIINDALDRLRPLIETYREEDNA